MRWGLDAGEVKPDNGRSMIAPRGGEERGEGMQRRLTERLRAYIPQRARLWLADQLDRERPSAPGRQPPRAAELTLRLGLLSVFYFAAFSLAFAYMTVFLTLRGYSDRDIGLYMALSNLAVLLIQLVWGRIADRWRCDALLLTILIAVSIIWPFILIRDGASPVLVLAMILLMSLTQRSLIPSVDAYITKQLDRFGIQRYSQIRAFGSGGAVAASLVGGSLIAGFGFHALYLVHAVALVGFLVVLQTGWRHLRDSPTAHVGDAPELVPETRVVASRGLKLRELPRGLLPISFIAMLAFLGAGIEASYLPVLYLQLGGEMRAFGLVYVAMTGSEIVGMFVYARLRRRVAILPLFVTSLVMFVCKFLAVAFSPTHVWLIPAQLLQGASFALLFPALVDFLSQISRPEARASALALSTMISTGIGFLVGNLSGAAIVDRLSIQAAFIFSAGLSGLAVVLSLVLMPRYEAARRRPARVP